MTGVVPRHEIFVRKRRGGQRGTLGASAGAGVRRGSSAGRGRCHGGLRAQGLQSHRRDRDRSRPGDRFLPRSARLRGALAGAARSGPARPHDRAARAAGRDRPSAGPGPPGRADPLRTATAAAAPTRRGSTTTAPRTSRSTSTTSRRRSRPPPRTGWRRSARSSRSTPGRTGAARWSTCRAPTAC